MDPEIIFNVQHGPVWGWQVAMDLFLGGAGVGALLFAIFADEVFKGRYRRICQSGAWLAPILIAIGLALIMLKLGRPLHSVHTYLTVNPSSPLWWGGILQPLLLAGAAGYAWLWRNGAEPGPVRSWLGRALVPLAVLVGVYHGLLLGAHAATPLWGTVPTALTAIFGFVSTGIAVVMLVHLGRMKLGGRLADQAHVDGFLGDMRIVAWILVTALVLQLTTFVSWWLGLRSGSLEERQVLATAAESYGGWFLILVVGLGILLPLALAASAALRGVKRNAHTLVPAIAVACTLVLVGGFAFRLVLLLGGQVELLSPTDLP